MQGWLFCDSPPIPRYGKPQRHQSDRHPIRSFPAQPRISPPYNWKPKWNQGVLFLPPIGLSPEDGKNMGCVRESARGHSIELPLFFWVSPFPLSHTPHNLPSPLDKRHREAQEECSASIRASGGLGRERKGAFYQIFLALWTPPCTLSHIPQSQPGESAKEECSVSIQAFGGSGESDHRLCREEPQKWALGRQLWKCQPHPLLPKDQAKNWTNDFQTYHFYKIFYEH